MSLLPNIHKRNWCAGVCLNKKDMARSDEANTRYVSLRLKKNMCGLTLTVPVCARATLCVATQIDFLRRGHYRILSLKLSTIINIQSASSTSCTGIGLIKQPNFATCSAFDKQVQKRTEHVMALGVSSSYTALSFFSVLPLHALSLVGIR